MSKIVSKDTIQRLIRDVKNIVKHPLHDNGIYYEHDDTDMLKGYALIIGSSDTPYYGGYYFFEFSYPHNYPQSPPSVTFHTNGDGIRFNPNLYKSGKVCLSVLNTWKGDQWTSCQTISTILLALCTVLCNNPLLNEPGVTKKHRDFHKYNEIIQYKNIEIAILHILNKKEGIFKNTFDMFYPIVKQKFIENKDNIKSHINEMCSKEPDYQITTGLYSMTVHLCYKSLKKYFEQTCLEIK